MKTITIFFSLLLAVNLYAQETPSKVKILKGKEYTDNPKETSVIANIDAIQYVQDAIIYDGKTFITGYKFGEDGNSSNATIICINNKNGKEVWSKTIDTQKTVALINIALIKERIYLTGASGVEGPVFDDQGKFKHRVNDLHPTIISILPNGNDYLYQEIKEDKVFKTLNSPVISHDGNFYMSYSLLGPKGTKVVKFDDKLNIIKKSSAPISALVFSHQKLHMVNNVLTFTGVSNHQIFSATLDENLNGQKNHLQTPKKESAIVTIQKEDKNLKIMSRDYKKNIISIYDMIDNKLNIDQEFSLQKTDRFFAFSDENDFFVVTSKLNNNKLSFSIGKILNNHQVELVKNFTIIDGEAYQPAPKKILKDGNNFYALYECETYDAKTDKFIKSSKLLKIN